MDERLDDLTIRDLLGRLATRDPVPGGGSASALAGALGAALVEMVVALSRGRPAAEAHEDALAGIAAEAARRHEELLELASEDAAAYAGVVRARRLPRDGDAERWARDRAIATAQREATLAPLAILRASGEVVRLAQALAPIANPHAISDVGVAALLAGTAVRGAALNVEINLPFLPDGDPLVDEGRRALAGGLADLLEREADVRRQVAEVLG